MKVIILVPVEFTFKHNHNLIHGRLHGKPSNYMEVYFGAPFQACRIKRYLLQKRSKESSISTKASSPGGSPQEKMRNMSRFDRQLDRITRMLDTSTEGLLGPSAQKPMARGKGENMV